MTTKVFGDRKITIRRVTASDIKNAKKFQIFINSLVEEEAKILANREMTLKDEKEFLKRTLASAKEGTRVTLVAECDGEIISTTHIESGRWRKNHIGTLGIAIKRGYRGIGLGSYLLAALIRAAKKELHPAPKMIQLEVYSDNKPAIGLYKKMGFKRVARLPKQVQHKGKLVDELVMQLHLS